MHAFVDEMDFTGLKFVEALRQFLQNFRLPGEAQKIDRFMLKFAARYLQGNPATFKSADTAYVLAYSVIMLNTDQHNPQVKKRMSKEDFVKNNRGIDEGKDLAENVLVEIFDEIALNEINMKDEQQIKNQTPEIVHNLLSVIAPDTDLFKTKKEPSSEISKASEQMAEHTEATIKELHLNYSKASGGTPPKYITAKRSEHVKQMFEIIWMSLLAGISTPLQESDDIDLNQLSLDAFQESLHLAFMFGMELEAKAFFSTLQKFNFLNNPMHAKFKNILALKTCIEIGARDGNNLGEIWNDLVICISQYDKFFQAQEEPTTSGQIKRDTSGKLFKGIDETLFNGQIQHITAAIDKIFSNSVKLSGDAIVQLVKALCKTSWTEITTSVDHNQPRMYCLQRLVEISYFNMTRIRVEWANTWAILGEHFNHVGAYPNTNVGFFAIDKLRQLSIKFLELEELPNFKFQKDFLKSFEEIVANTPDAKIKDMCLACLQQIVQVKGKGLKSGWKTVLGCLIRATKEVESIVNLAFDIFKYIVKEHLGDVLQNGSFPELLAGNVEFCKCDRAPKAPPQGMEIFSKIMANASMFAAHIKNEHRTDTFNEQQEMNLRFWTPLLFGLHDVITSAETGFGIRSRAITSLFETIKKQGQDFDLKSWELLAKFVIFPIFDDLKQTDAAINSKAGGKESNTVIQSLDQLIEIFQVYQEKISFMLSDMLDLLKVCLMHKNEILSQVGSTCIQKLINKCHQGFNQHDWDLVANLFVFVFQETTPYFLVFKYEGAEAGFIDSANKIMKQDICLPPERKQFQAQLYKCGLNAMAVKTLQDMLFNDPKILNSIPFCTAQTLLDCFEHSFQFSGLFNSSIGLRTALNKMGYMSQIPNLLKIETSSAQSLLDMLIKMQEKGLLQDRFFGYIRLTQTMS
jgi:brefeldin A-inhibited guanine nucleotide-exchange protein